MDQEVPLTTTNVEGRLYMGEVNMHNEGEEDEDEGNLISYP